MLAAFVMPLSAALRSAESARAVLYLEKEENDMAFKDGDSEEISIRIRINETEQAKKDSIVFI